MFGLLVRTRFLDGYFRCHLLCAVGLFSSIGLAVGLGYLMPGMYIFVLLFIACTFGVLMPSYNRHPMRIDMDKNARQAWEQWLGERPMPIRLTNTDAVRIIQRDFDRRVRTYWPPTSRAKLRALWEACFWIYYFGEEHDGKFVRRCHDPEAQFIYMLEVGGTLVCIALTYVSVAWSGAAAPLAVALILVEGCLAYFAFGMYNVKDAEKNRVWHLIMREVRRDEMIRNDPEFLKREIEKYKRLVKSQAGKLVQEAAEKAKFRADAEAVMGNVPGLDRFVDEKVMPRFEELSRRAEKAARRWDMKIALPVTIVVSVAATELFHRLIS